MDTVGWLPDATEASLRTALGSAAPDLPVGELVVSLKPPQPDPRYWSGSATIDERFVVKFAWAEAPANRVWREGVILQRLASADAALPVPRVVRVSQQPALAIMEVLPGGPMSWDWASQRSSDETHNLGKAIGSFLARLHALPANGPIAGAALRLLRRERPLELRVCPRSGGHDPDPRSASTPVPVSS